MDQPHHHSYDGIPLSPLCQLMRRMIPGVRKRYYDGEVAREAAQESKLVHNETIIADIKQMIAVYNDEKKKTNNNNSSSSSSDRSNDETKDQGASSGEGIAYGDDRAIWYAIEISNASLLGLILRSGGSGTKPIYTRVKSRRRTPLSILLWHPFPHPHYDTRTDDSHSPSPSPSSPSFVPSSCTWYRRSVALSLSPSYLLFEMMHVFVQYFTDLRVTANVAAAAATTTTTAATSTSPASAAMTTSDSGSVAAVAVAVTAGTSGPYNSREAFRFQSDVIDQYARSSRRFQLADDIIHSDDPYALWLCSKRSSRQHYTAPIHNYERVRIAVDYAITWYDTKAMEWTLDNCTRHHDHVTIPWNDAIYVHTLPTEIITLQDTLSTMRPCTRVIMSLAMACIIHICDTPSVIYQRGQTAAQLISLVLQRYHGIRLWHDDPLLRRVTTSASTWTQGILSPSMVHYPTALTVRPRDDGTITAHDRDRDHGCNIHSIPLLYHLRVAIPQLVAGKRLGYLRVYHTVNRIAAVVAPVIVRDIMCIWLMGTHRLPQPHTKDTKGNDSKSSSSGGASDNKMNDSTIMRYMVCNALYDPRMIRLIRDALTQHIHHWLIGESMDVSRAHIYRDPTKHISLSSLGPRYPLFHPPFDTA